jgi:MFS family permease
MSLPVQSEPNPAAGNVLSPGWLTWFWEAPAAARRQLIAAWLGWLLDAFDVMLYALVLGNLINDFAMTKAVAGLLGSLTLVASGLGGVLFGLIADWYGRRPALISSLLIYSCFTFACGLSTSVWQLGAFRFLLGLGMGGEWTSGAALVSESWPDAHRAKALGLMQSAWSIGYALAGVAVAVVLPRFGWRAVFFLGIIPAIVAVWVQRRIDESPAWIKVKGVHADVSPLSAIFGPKFRRFTVLLTFLSVTTIFAYWGLNLWVPAYLSLPTGQGGIGLSTWMMSLLVVIIQIGTFFGYVSFGFVADAVGRRRSFVTFILMAALTTVAFGRVRSPVALAILGPVTAYFGSGFFSGFGAVAAELYPTAVRATAQGFTFNVGRIGSALAPFVVGSFAETHGFGSAFGLLAIALLLGASTWFWLPETRSVVAADIRA